VLLLEMGTAQTCIEALHELRKRNRPKQRRLLKAVRQVGGETAAAELASTETLRTTSPMFTTFWLVDLIERVQQPKMPDLRNVEGDELLLCEARFPFAAGTTGDHIQTALDGCPEFRRADVAFWNWISFKKPATHASSHGSLTFETRLDDDMLVLGSVELKADALVLAVNSQRRCDLGCALLSGILGERLKEPSLTTETVDQMVASARSEPQQLDIPEDGSHVIVHDYLDRHYREVLDQPVPMLGGKSPRAAVRTASGRIKVAGWLKMMENTTAKAAEHNSALAIYNFGWLWTELGIDELRR
jgi:hypothetical protein